MPEEVVQILSKCAAEIEQHLHAIIAPPTNQHVVTIHSLLDAVVQARISRDNMAALRLLHKVSGKLKSLRLKRHKQPRYFACLTTFSLKRKMRPWSSS